MGKKRIVVFTHHSGLNGGATQSLLTLLENLSDSFSLLVVCPSKGDFVDALVRLRIQHVVISFPWNTSFGDYKKNIPGGIISKIRGYRYVIFKKLLPVVNEFKPDIFYTNTSVIYWGAILSLLKRKPHIWHIRELIGGYGIKHDFGIHFFKRILKRSKIIIVNSEAVKRGYGLNNNSGCKTVYNGIYSKSSLMKIKEEWSGKPMPGQTFAIVGVIDPTKGQLDAIEAFGEWLKEYGAKAKLYLIGSITNEAYYKKIEQYINNHGLSDSVIYEGHCANIADRYKDIDVLILSSVSEAFGRVLVEAMVHNVMVIARNIGGIPEIVDHNHTGFLFNNKTELVECLNRTQTVDISILNTIKENAFQKVLKHFSIESYVDGMEEAFSSV
jgi:Glycosyltransferase